MSPQRSPPVEYGHGLMICGGTGAPAAGEAMRRATTSFWMISPWCWNVFRKRRIPAFARTQPGWANYPAVSAGAETGDQWCDHLLSLLKLAFEPPWWRIALARLALRVFPGWTQNTPGKVAHLSRDQEYLLSMPDLELMHRLLSPRLYFAMVTAGHAALEKAVALEVPLLLIHGADDQVTCPRATQELCDRVASKDKTFILYPEARHETHNDLCRDRVLADICGWINDRVVS